MRLATFSKQFNNGRQELVQLLSGMHVSKKKLILLQLKWELQNAGKKFLQNLTLANTQEAPISFVDTIVNILLHSKR